MLTAFLLFAAAAILLGPADHDLQMGAWALGSLSLINLVA